MKIPPGVLFWQVQCGGEPRENPEHAERIICPIWPVNIPGSPHKSWTNWPVGRTDRRLSLDILTLDMAKQQIMNGWMDEWAIILLHYRCRFYFVHSLYNDYGLRLMIMGCAS